MAGYRDIPPGNTYSAGFPDPFRDLATSVMPNSAPAMFRYAEHFALSQETFREALRRIAAYFITRLELDGDAEESEKKDYIEYLTQRAGLIPALLQAAESTLVYGNGYVSVLRPFLRFLRCPGKKENGQKCNAQYSFNIFATDKRYKFSWQDGFHGACPACKYQGDFGEPLDRVDADAPVKIKIWNPYDIHPTFDGYTGDTVEFDWVIPSEYRMDVRRGLVPVLARAPWPVLQAIIRNEDFRFTPGYVHHWRDSMLAGVRSRGLGIPRAIVNFRTLYYIQILRRFSEALAAGHIAPLRLLSPVAGGRDGEAGDMIRNAALTNVQGRIMNIVAQHMRDPGGWHFSPVPLQYQSLGADGRALTPRDLLDQGYDTLLNGVGTPTELYRMTLQTQAAPVGLRLFRMFNAPFFDGLNRVTSFVVDKCVLYNRWEAVRGRLAEPDLVDSLENQNIRMQMAQAGWISRSDAMKVVGADFTEQTRKRYAEQLIEAQEQAKAEETQKNMGLSVQLSQMGDPANTLQQQQQAAQEQQGQGQGQGQGGGGAPQGQGGQPSDGQQAQGGLGDIWSLIPPPYQPIDPVELQQRAQSVAQALLDPSVTQTQRTSALNQIRKQHETFHGAVRMAMQNIRSQARSVGQEMAMPQVLGR